MDRRLAVVTMILPLLLGCGTGTGSEVEPERGACGVAGESCASDRDCCAGRCTAGACTASAIPACRESAFTVFPTELPGLIGDSRIPALAIDRGAVWIATSETVARLDLGTGRIERLFEPDGINRSMQVAVDDESVFYSGKNAIIARAKDGGTSRSLATGTSMFALGRTDLYVLRFGRGPLLAAIDKRSGAERSLATIPEVAGTPFPYLFATTSQVYVELASGLYSFSVATRALERLTGDPHALAVIDDHLVSATDGEVTEWDRGSARRLFTIPARIFALAGDRRDVYSITLGTAGADVLTRHPRDGSMPTILTGVAARPAAIADDSCLYVFDGATKNLVRVRR